MMTSHNFDIEELPDNLKCEQCKLVLKDACQVPCGCTFCRVCINDMMVSGVEFCPGLSEYCRESSLPLFKSDYKANNSVSKLNAKCPHNGCTHKCQLVNMDEHMRECPKRNVKCPFRELGCTRDKLIAEEVDVHLQQENRSHSEILIGMIANFGREMNDRKKEIAVLKQRDEENRREIDMLKQSDETSRREIEMLDQINQNNKKTIDVLNDRDESSKREIEVMKCDLIMKTEQIRTVMDQMIHIENENKSIRNDIKSIQGEKEDLASRVRILSEEIENKIDERRVNDELDIARVIEHIDNEITAVNGLIGSNIDELIIDIRSIKERTDSKKEIIRSLTAEVQSMEALVGQVDASCEWLIEVVVRMPFWSKSQTNNHCFTGAKLRYTYQLAYYSGSGELSIFLNILPGQSNSKLAWPFEGRVLVTVQDKNESEASMSISRQCKIEKPSYNKFSTSDPFKFLHSELVRTGVNLDCGVLVSCVIVPEASR